ncbi:hypothetical protein ABID22_000616 [Pontibacter aydingkolensis]
MAVAMASCSSSKKSTGSNGRIIVIDGKQVRIEGARKDNGLHKGWTKNPNNPHHPNTTNPGHTKQKGKSAVNNNGKPGGKNGKKKK